MIMPKGSAYLELINEEVKRLHQMGFIQRWFKEYLPLRNRCSKTRNNLEATNHIVNLDDMQGSFLVLLMGVMGGIFLIVLECLVFRWFRSREKEVIKPFTE
jgi:glutamate receptor, ionotropic, invertebrate